MDTNIDHITPARASACRVKKEEEKGKKKGRKRKRKSNCSGIKTMTLYSNSRLLSPELMYSTDSEMSNIKGTQSRLPYTTPLTVYWLLSKRSIETACKENSAVQ